MMPAEEEPRHRRAGARARAGRLIGDLTGLLATLKGLPLAYNRDLQEDKEPLFDALDQVDLHAALRCQGLLATIDFDTDRMQAAADDPLLAATDLAEWLVRARRALPRRPRHRRRRTCGRRSRAAASLADLVAADDRARAARPPRCSRRAWR